MKQKYEQHYHNNFITLYSIKKQPCAKPLVFKLFTHQMSVSLQQKSATVVDEEAKVGQERQVKPQGFSAASRSGHMKKSCQETLARAAFRRGKIVFAGLSFFVHVDVLFADFLPTNSISLQEFISSSFWVAKNLCSSCFWKLVKKS